MVDIKPTIPRYCRVNRLVRDIPAHHVVAGNRRSNLREEAQRMLAKRGLHCECIRCREVREQPVDPARLVLNDLSYAAGGGEEHFLSFDSPDDRLTGYLRLHLPEQAPPRTLAPDLHDAAIVRELHIYGQSLSLGETQDGAVQHVGLGARLLAEAERIAHARHYRRLAVISAIGTREYYAARGFENGDLYQVRPLA
jgi:elongator complex protein 3